VTTTPDRERDRVLAPGVVRRPDEPVDRPSRDRLDRAAWSKAVMLLNVVLIGGVAIVGLTYVRNANTPDGPAAGQPSGVASTLAEPEPAPDSAAPDGTAPVSTPPPTIESPASPADAATEPPRVRPTMRSNFAQGDDWPVGAGFREAGSMAWPLGVVDRLMTHGAPEGPNAVSWLEKWMKTDVRTIGARVLFAPNHSGAAALTAWHTSVLDLSGQQQPRTGMRLVVLPGQWRLVAIDGQGTSPLASGSYAQDGHAATFNLVRRGETVWVTDPEGNVTRVTDRRVASLSGPWASWELRDSSPDKRPAGFQEIWAG
jgi:hypothetical protein